MEYISLGKSGEKVSEVGLGTWMLNRNQPQELGALRAGIEAGINFIDTAELYGTEPLVARATKREKGLFIATKVSPTHFAYDAVLRACDGSLAKLDVRCIDLYQLHWPNPSVPIAETMRAMEKLVADGKIRYIGLSNFSVKEMKEAQEALKKNELVSNQVEYSPLVRYIEKELLDYCKKQGVSVIAYSPFAHGRLFAAKYSKLNSFLAGIGAKYGKSATQTLLNWMLGKGDVIPIPKASTREHVLEIAGSSGWRLRSEDFEAINHFLEGFGGGSPW